MRPEGTVDSDEAAKLLEISRATFFKYRREADFPAPVQVGRGGRHSLYRSADLLAWRDRRMAGSGSGSAHLDESPNKNG